MNQEVIFDIEILGDKKPVFLVCTFNTTTKKKNAFWLHKRGHMKALEKLMLDGDLTWVGFNSINFDLPLASAATDGLGALDLKAMCRMLTDKDERVMHWEMPKHFDYTPLELDHIDLFEVAPGVRISLKLYMGRLGAKHLIDLPFHYDQDLTPAQCKIVETYCLNDIEGTVMMRDALSTEIDLRIAMGEQYGLDLRSKSDAQLAEAVLKKQAGIGKATGYIPSKVNYSLPSFIKTRSAVIKELIALTEETVFKINFANGQLIEPEWMSEDVVLGSGSYKYGLGGLHSTHDKSICERSDEEYEVSDFDAASYYPNIILKAGFAPTLSGNKGHEFLEAYEDIYHQRLGAKRAGNKRVSNSLKICLNGTFGKLGNKYSAIYSPDLLLAVTIAGQLNLFCLIYELELIKGVRIVSANTDGIAVKYPKAARQKVLDVFVKNVKRTGFEYEETCYKLIAMKDVNNYIAITDERDEAVISTRGIEIHKSKPNIVKAKGLYASNNPALNPLYLMKNPTMEVCSNMAKDYLLYGWLPEDSIGEHTNMRDFVSIRQVKGGGVQHPHSKLVDDWVLTKDLNSAKNEWQRQAWIGTEQDDRVVKRKSRPKPVEVGYGGDPFGRIARWYMTTKKLPPITYVESGNKVALTEGAMLCMTLPDKLPKDLDVDWYIAETYSILKNIGVDVEN